MTQFLTYRYSFKVRGLGCIRTGTVTEFEDSVSRAQLQCHILRTECHPCRYSARSNLPEQVL